MPQRRYPIRFREDIDPANTWVVSDSHFGHDNIVGFCHRPEDHDQVMIAEWRAHVPDDATILHLGDLCYKGNAWFKNITAKELTGARKILIRGNHDKNPTKFYTLSGWQLARPFSIHYESSVGKGEFFDVSFAHYPWDDEEVGRPMPPWEVRLHGHIHNNGYTRDSFVPFLRGHINLSCEQTKYRPVNLKALLDGALLGEYPPTTDEQLRVARDRKAGIR